MGAEVQIRPNYPLRTSLLVTAGFLYLFDASKHEKEQISRTVQEMFEEADM
ncbi:DinI-like family protein [Salmonella enterica]|nr:DinI-like family protein [Salmonella enterica]